jgi:hypothetical protein
VIPLSVACEPSNDGWACEVTVGDDPAATLHSVRVDHSVLGELAPPGTSPEELVRASFEFLLEREPREAIMRRFELPIIGRFFSGYADSVRGRLGR